jgi:DNA-binding transcriptional MerR regulator
MTSPASSEARLSIGDVLASLRPEFPDVTISKIRFLEAQGLVDPSRTPAGYRKFSPLDVERLRYVLTAQRDHYLPLKVIKDQVDALEAGSVPTEVAVRRPPTPPVRLTREQMLAETGMTEAALDQLDSSGLLNRRRGGHYEADDLALARVVCRIERFGLEPRHLRAFKGAADRELGLLQQAVGNRNRNRDAAQTQRARTEAEQLLELFLELHATLLRAGARREMGT